MQGFFVRFASVTCLLVILTGPSSALFWRPTQPTYPTDPNDNFYQAFQTVPDPSVTADKLLANFLHIGGRTKRSPRVEDNVIVMDGSGSIGSCQFDKGKKALKYLLGIRNPNFDRKYAAVTFDSTATVNFKFLSQSSAARQIMNIPYSGGSTNTPAGLAEAKRLFEDPSSGRRAYSKAVVLLLTDGESDNTMMTIDSAEALKNAGVEIQVAAVGENIYGINEMVRVASYKPNKPLSPENILIYRFKNYNQVWDVVKLILEKSATGTWRIDKKKYDPPCH